MTIPEYDKECDCDVCKADREIRQSERDKTISEFEKKIMQAKEEGFGGVLISGLYEWIAELRQAGEQG